MVPAQYPLALFPWLLAMEAITTMIPRATPTQTVTIAHVLALREESCAPWKSPRLNREFTCAANTIAAIPVGQKQKIVARIAHTR
jgi:hypothetical protein